MNSRIKCFEIIFLFIKSLNGVLGKNNYVLGGNTFHFLGFILYNEDTVKEKVLKILQGYVLYD